MVKLQLRKHRQYAEFYVILHSGMMSVFIFFYILKLFKHFYRAMLCICGTNHGPVSVCLSVCLCLSVTSRCSTKRAKCGIIQTTPLDSPGTLVF